ncbi:MAG: hypothetical protein K6T83_24145, partial [Alicyclobacillus sp.]|nr:hypothetical protein [Alicyclobacillus sp.]
HAAAPLVAGALVSGAMVGDRSSPMSTSVMVMSTACGLPYNQTLHQLMRTAIAPFTITLLLYMAANRWLSPADTPGHLHAHPMHAAWWLLVQPALVLVIAIIRAPLLLNLGVAIAVGLAISIATHRVTWTALPAMLWNGWVGAPHATAVGGMEGMVPAVALIAAAGLFQGAAQIGNAMDTLAALVFQRARRHVSGMLLAYAVSALFSLLMGSQMLSVVMSGNTLKPHLVARGWTNTAVLRVVSDTAELLPAVIPWNLLGLQAAAILGVAGDRLAPFAWYILLSVALSILRSARPPHGNRPATESRSASRLML